MPPPPGLCHILSCHAFTLFPTWPCCVTPAVSCHPLLSFPILSWHAFMLHQPLACHATSFCIVLHPFMLCFHVEPPLAMSFHGLLCCTTSSMSCFHVAPPPALCHAQEGVSRMRVWSTSSYSGHGFLDSFSENALFSNHFFPLICQVNRS